MAISRDDRYVTDALGRALAGAQVYWCQPQPASTATNPPSPLATIYTSTSGGTPLTQPVLTDGFGHADAYMDNSVLYTVVIWHPLFGENPIVLPDQVIGGGGSGGTGLTPFAGTLLGTINGTNTVFTLTTNGTTPLTIMPSQATVWNNFGLIPGLGYALSIVGGNVVATFATAPQTGDSLYAQGFYA
jgi:hypothetical protein